MCATFSFVIHCFLKKMQRKLEFFLGASMVFGISKLMTRCTPSISKPRPATSVATRMSYLR